MRLATTLLFLAACSSHAGAPEGKAPSASAAVAPASLDAVALTRLDGRPMPAAELSDKVVLFVNVASRCGFTRQYEGLQALYTELEPRGFAIVGVPSNQFGGQEPGTAEEIASFCKMNYGVTFPMLAKQEVKGQGRSDLYDYLVGDGDEVGWNFEKFLVGRDGKVVSRFPSRVSPDDADLRTAIEAALGPAT